MAKFKLILTSVFEYEPNPSSYDTTDIKEMLQADVDAVSEDPFTIFDNVPFIVTGEIVEEEKPN